MISDIRLIVTDMDGTLLDAEHTLPSDFVTAQQHLQSRGIQWCIASGRQYANLWEKFHALGVEVAIIAENGGLASDVGESEPFFRDLTPLDFFRPVVEAALQIPNATPVLCGPQRASAWGKYPENIRQASIYFYTIEQWMHWDEIHNPEVCKLAVYHPDGGEVLLPYLMPFASESVRVIHSGAHWVDVQAARIDKGCALRALLQRRGLEPRQALVFGDYLNDIGMMQIGTQGVAMANAMDAVKQAARFETLANTQDGVLHFLRRISLL